MFIRDPGDGEWTVSPLDNTGIRPALQPQSAAWTGTGWVVGTSQGVFRSALGQEPWSPSGPGLGALRWSSFAPRGPRLFAAFDIVNAAVIAHSGDDGASWQPLETLPGVFVYELTMSGDDLYAARAATCRRLLGVCGCSRSTSDCCRPAPV